MEPTPHTAPTSEITSHESARRSRGRWLAGIGVALFSGPFWGMMGTVMGMSRAFNTLKEQSHASPEILSDDIGFAMASTMVGILVGLAGVIPVLIVLFATKNREKWFFWWVVPLSAFWCLASFPFGLLVGLPILILFIVKRAEFEGQSEPIEMPDN